MANVLPNGNPDHLRNRSPNSTYFLRNRACSTLFLHIRDMKAIHLDGVVVNPQHSLVESRDRHAHMLLPPHELGSTNGDIRQFHHPFPIGHLFNVLGIHSALAWRNKAFGHGAHAEREGKWKIKALGRRYLVFSAASP